MAIKSDDDEEHDLPYFSRRLSLSFSIAHTVCAHANVSADNEFAFVRANFSKATQKKSEHTK